MEHRENQGANQPLDLQYQELINQEQTKMATGGMPLSVDDQLRRDRDELESRAKAEAIRALQAYCAIRQAKQDRCTRYSSRDNVYGDSLPTMLYWNEQLTTHAYALTDLLGKMTRSWE
ncbi:hypothetical protein SH17_gp2 [Mulberry badnavirus 1]|uniref:Uncharacterized protein n=1 Tax=Mulberry badnavirus 1 TaxID=1227557 RepID=A0A0X8XXP1_9VIRU|nr:hypothetical protein SH17_gp2 [Mulberry badnavirus 1]CVK17376.1 hypothetical protein [Mulberry badnavirus 1]